MVLKRFFLGPRTSRNCRFEHVAIVAGIFSKLIQQLTRTKETSPGWKVLKFRLPQKFGAFRTACFMSLFRGKGWTGENIRFRCSEMADLQPGWFQPPWLVLQDRDPAISSQWFAIWNIMKPPTAVMFDISVWHLPSMPHLEFSNSKISPRASWISKVGCFRWTNLATEWSAARVVLKFWMETACFYSSTQKNRCWNLAKYGEVADSSW